jgi:hypothetical protein
MSAIPIPDEVAQAIDAAHERQVELPRSHLGASQLGHACDRWLWLSFRWAVREPFPGRILRLFRRGRMEEATIAADLKAIGIDIHSTEGAQARVDFGSHVSGSLDGIIESGVPGAPKARHIFEAKTHSKKSFDDLVKHGVEKSKPVHAAQMQVYMHGTNIDRALYFAICKDDDRIYTERLRYSRTEAERLIARGHRIALADRMPEPLSSNPSWYVCRFCSAHDFCHGSKKTKEVNCRTCAHSTAEPSTPDSDAHWTCARFERSVIPIETQYTGCGSHVLHPDLVPWQRLDGPDAWTAIYVIDGREVANGEGDANVFGSRELLGQGN